MVGPGENGGPKMGDLIPWPYGLTSSHYLAIFPFIIRILFSWFEGTSITFLSRIQETHPIMSFAISRDRKQALLNVASQVKYNSIHF